MAKHDQNVGHTPCRMIWTVSQNNSVPRPWKIFHASLPISVLRVLDTEANKIYDRNHQLYDAALLTRCYTQHALRQFIDSETNHKQHFIKIPFITKAIEFIDLPRIFKDRSVTSSIPIFFQNFEPPIICCKYNKPLRNTRFIFNKLVSDLDIHANTPESWDCKDSKFIYPAAGHVITGNLKIISDSRTRYIVSNGPKYTGIKLNENFIQMKIPFHVHLFFFFFCDIYVLCQYDKNYFQQCMHQRSRSLTGEPAPRTWNKSWF